MKSTYGTGCFALLNTGTDMVRSRNRLLTTVAYRLDGKTTYALEGAIFMAGASVQWLRDKLRLFEDAAETGALAKARRSRIRRSISSPPLSASARPGGTPTPAAPFTASPATPARPDLDARGARDLWPTRPRICSRAMRKDWKGARDFVLRVDGGMVASDWTMQF